MCPAPLLDIREQLEPHRVHWLLLLLLPRRLKLYRLQDFHEALRENEAGFRHHKIAFALEG
jgi:hypothetical protein